LRKYLIAAVAALTALCLTAVAMAQNPAPAPKLTIKKATPKDAGTKTKPKPARLSLLVKNNVESKTTMDILDLYLPKTWKVSGKGLPACDHIKLATERDASACPKGSKAGTGSANAILGPYSPTPSPLKFNVTVFNGTKKQILFLLQQVGGNVETALKGTVKKASGKYGTRISIKVPDGKGEYAQFPNIQQPAPGVYSALVDLSANIYLKKGSKSLFMSTGCTGGKYPFKATLRYSDNPTPPAKRTASTTASKSCTK
jgi:hypothetical protein